MTILVLVVTVAVMILVYLKLRKEEKERKKLIKALEEILKEDRESIQSEENKQ